MREKGQYQRHAEACLALAQQTSDSEQKALLLNMAQSWSRLAEQADHIESLLKQAQTETK
jgi:hypothetical protein